MLPVKDGSSARPCSDHYTLELLLKSAMLFLAQKDAASYTDRSEKHKLPDGRFNALSKAARAQVDKAGLSRRNFMKAWQADRQVCPASIYLSQTTARA